MTTATNLNDEDLLTGAFNVLGHHLKKKMQNSLPVKVTFISSDRKTVNVQPQIMLVDSDNNAIVRGEIKGVPVITSGAGGFLVSFNIQVGDLGWVEASDRDISLFIQSYSQSRPNTKRMHDFSDSRFVPDIMTNFTVAEEDSSAMTIQNRSGSVKIALDENEIRIKQDDITLNLSSGMIVGVAPSGFNFNGFTIGSTGAAESPISLTAPSAIIGGKELNNHIHPAGSPPGNTGVNS